MKLRKRFGQHFLHDVSIIDQLLRAIAPKPGQHLVEIGPGGGALTNRLLPLTDAFSAIELDRDLIPALQNLTVDYPHFELYRHDAMDFDYATLTPQPLRLVGNLPYNVSSQIILQLLHYCDHMLDMTFMVQQEMALRICATPNSKAYGRLTVMVQYHCHAEYLFIVPPSAFTPCPKVDSAVIRLTVKKPDIPVTDGALLQKLVAMAFNQRRKTLSNSLKGLVTAHDFSQVAIDPRVRAENMAVNDFVRLANHVSRQ